MVTRRMAGPIYITCPHCGTTYGPYSRLMLGRRQCSKSTCKKTFIAK